MERGEGFCMFMCTYVKRMDEKGQVERFGREGESTCAHIPKSKGGRGN